MTSEEWQMVWDMLQLKLWERDGREAEVARDFLKAFWGPEGDKDFGVGTDSMDAVLTPGNDGTGPEDEGDLWVPPEIPDFTFDDETLVAVAEGVIGGLEGFACPNANWEAENNSVEDGHSSTVACF